ncbi:MAG TPA: sigma-54 dependent transcriptional regulator [Treponemataceae bacterium]|nr:sigma-54 dependent transcriptional regulator [Treponemataceae bacterium]
MKKVLFLASRNEDACQLRYLSSSVWSLVCPVNSAGVISLCKNSDWDAILIDIDISGVFVIDLLEELREISGHPAYYILSRSPFFQLEDFYRRYGASGFFPLPEEMELLFLRIENIFSSTDDITIPNLIESTHLVGSSQAMSDIRRKIEKYARSLEPVLICGETGCGKELVAHALHSCSYNCEGPFAVQNVSCIPHDLAESLLFGSIRGSFTGSLDSAGIFEKAHNGTLFLDEIGTLDLTIQSKLLRILEEKHVCRLGCTKLRPAKFRLVCATNVDLLESVNSGVFRKDLFYRLDVLRITIPPLRDRREDIPILAVHFLKTLEKNLSISCFDSLKNYHWPGNVRQLFQCLKRAAVNSNSKVIYPEDIQF